MITFAANGITLLFTEEGNLIAMNNGTGWYATTYAADDHIDGIVREYVTPAQLVAALADD